MLNRASFLVTFLLLTSLAFAQGNFNFYGFNKDYQDVKFQLINNLIVIPLEINQKKLNFILDTGVNKTIVFNASPQDSVLLRNKRKIKLQGLGSGAPVEAVVSKNNRFRIGNLIGQNQQVFIIVDSQFDLSSKMGITIHGVIGYELFKDVLAYIQYNRKTIRFYNPKTFDENLTCKKCETFPLTLYNNKPYLDVNINLEKEGEDIPVRMLLDTGGSDALWIFEYSDPRIKAPKKFFKDVLGFGLSGTVMGKRSRIHKVSIGDFEIKSPTISFLDTVSSLNARRYELRNGSIGSNILKRFKVWIDYKNEQITLKKSSSLSGGFEYNMSGIEVVYDGKILVREQESAVRKDNYGRNLTNKSSINNLSIVTNYVYRFKPSFRVSTVVKGSPADLAGVKVNDVLVKLNGDETYNLSLSEIMGKFRQRENKKINLTLLRKGVTKRISFRLKRRL